MSLSEILSVLKSSTEEQLLQFSEALNLQSHANLRNKANAGKNDDIDISFITNAINYKSAAGINIISSFKKRFGEDLTRARARKGGNRNTHYDFEIEVNEEWKKVEHKGGQKFMIPSLDDKPWLVAVQFYNGGAEKFAIAKKYAKEWYDIHIISGLLKKHWKISAKTPSFEEWWKKDCIKQGSPGTSFGKELKEAVRKERGPKSSLLEERIVVLSALEFTDEDKKQLIDEVFPIVKEVLNDKEYWLSIHGNLNGEFHSTWYPQFTVSSILDVTFNKKKDLEMIFKCANGFTFNGILRWGSGAGFSNLRMDLK